MIQTLTLLISFYFFYMLSLVVQDPGSFIIIIFLTAIYTLCFGVINKKPAHSLYGFLIIALFFPKGGNNFVLFRIEELPLVSMAVIFQSMAAFAICLNILRFKDHQWRMPHKLNLFCYVVFFMIIVSFAMGLVRLLVGDYLTGARVEAEELAWNVHMLIGLIFLYGCTLFVKQMRQIEKIFLIIIVLGIALVIESVLYVYLALPLPLTNYVFHENGRYHSIFFFDFVTLTLVLFASIGFIFYFGFTRKNYILFLLAPLMFLPMLPTFQRAPVVSGVMIVLAFLLLYKNIPIKFGLATMSVFIIGSLILLSKIDETISNLEFISTRPDYFVSYMSSWVARMGAYIRGIEAFIYSMPFGVGATRMSIVMGSQSMPTYLSSFVQPGEMRNFYFDIASGNHITGPHNFYINFLGEYGILGVIFFLLFIGFCIRGFMLSGKYGKRLAKYRPELFTAQVAAYSILLGIGFWFLFYHYIFYWLLFFLLFIILFTASQYRSELENNAMQGGS